MASENNDEIFLVDGSGYIFRAYFALPQNLTNPAGMPVGAVLGFTNMMMKLLNDLKAPYIAVIFDAAKKNFRYDIYDQYKANREDAPEDLIPQFPLFRVASEAFGVPATRVIRETESRDTFENAGNTQDLLKENGLENCLLVTSAFHMPRSVGLFRKLGLTVLPWPTDYRTTGTAHLGLDVTQPSINAQLMTTALREWTGLAFYRLAGRTDAFLPQ